MSIADPDLSDVLLQPGRSGVVANEYEVGRRYRDVYLRALQDSPYRALVSTGRAEAIGYDIVPVLDAAGVAYVGERCFDAQGQGAFHSLSTSEMLAILDRVITDQVQHEVRAIFKTDFAVLGAQAEVTRPRTGDEAPAALVSFKWHCDMGPRAHLKLIVYLDGPDSHDGATLVLDRATTDRLKQIGYPLGPLEQRLVDLTPLAEKFDLGSLTPERLTPQAGEGVLFEPMNVLHRGDVPSFGMRRMFTLLLIPFPYHWRLAFQRMETCVRQNVTFDFPVLDI